MCDVAHTCPQTLLAIGYLPRGKRGYWRLGRPLGGSLAYEVPFFYSLAYDNA